MQSPTGSPPSTPDSTTAKKALLDAFDHVLKTQADEREARRLEAEARRRSTGSRILILMCLVALAFIGGYLYVERPDWVFPPAPTPESTIVREASLRISIANAAQHIERYRQRNGRLPATLDEAGATTPGLAYEPGISGYQLHTTLDGAALSYQSSQSLAKFVGNSFAVIARRGS
jgi:hypothetical protein